MINYLDQKDVHRNAGPREKGAYDHPKNMLDHSFLVNSLKAKIWQNKMF